MLIHTHYHSIEYIKHTHTHTCTHQRTHTHTRAHIGARVPATGRLQVT